jgi:DNA-binding transcriptional regulator YhcF (GntR family)
MEFSAGKPIYLQIADYVCEKILSKEWKEGGRIPSVRELAVIVEVNPNTVMRTFTFLQEKKIINNQRGVGFFVSDNGFEQTMNYKSEHFISTDLKNVFIMMDLLNISFNQLKDYYTKYKSEN